jgi:hypothetical protein
LQHSAGELLAGEVVLAVPKSCLFHGIKLTMTGKEKSTSQIEYLRSYHCVYKDNKKLYQHYEICSKLMFKNRPCTLMKVEQLTCPRLDNKFTRGNRITAPPNGILHARNVRISFLLGGTIWIFLLKVE